MAIHNLTTEQLQKFIGAIGGIPQSIESGQFTTKQLKAMAKQVKGLEDWPKITDDPQVNFAVDCVVDDYGEELIYDEELYVDEIKASRARGTFA